MYISATRYSRRIEEVVNFTFTGEVDLPCKTYRVTQGVCHQRQVSPLISRFGRENRRARRRLHNDLGRSCGPRHGTRIAPQLRNCQRRPKCHRSLARVSFSGRLTTRFGAIECLDRILGFTNAFRNERERERESGEPILLSLRRDIFTDKARTTGAALLSRYRSV